MKYFSKNIGDFMTATRRLSMTARGAYNDLIDEYYATEQSLPADQATLENITGARTQVERDAVKRVAAEFFELRDGRLYQDRIEEQIAKYREETEKNVRNGRKGGRPKTQNKPSGFPVGSVSETQAITQTKAIQKPVTSNQEDGSSNHQAREARLAKSTPLPDWVPPEAWTAYVAMRRAIKKPLTVDGIPLAIKKLADLRDLGHDPQLVLEQSTLNSWQGLFELRVTNGARRPSNGDQMRDSATKFIARGEIIEAE